MHLSKDVAELLLYVNPGECIYKNEKVDDIPGDLTRWTQRRQLVIKDKHGKYWASDYEAGLTEYQDTRPWEDEEDAFFYPVTRHEITSYEYRRTNEQGKT